MNLPSGDLIEIVGHNFRRLLGVFVSGVVGGLRYHMTRSGHVIGAMSMLLGVLGPCRGLRMGGVSGSLLPLLSCFYASPPLGLVS